MLNLLDSHDMARFLTAGPGDTTALPLATIFQMTYPGAPSIYYGDEIGLPGGHDPDCRRAFPWDRQQEWDTATLNLTRQLVQARHSTVALRHGTFDVTYAQGDQIAYTRAHTEGNAYVALNCAHHATRIPLTGVQPGIYTDVLTGRMLELGGDTDIEVPARGGVVLVPARAEGTV